eukprot:3235320-Pyramimonas_sp.AAC.1
MHAKRNNIFTHIVRILLGRGHGLDRLWPAWATNRHSKTQFCEPKRVAGGGTNQLVRTAAYAEGVGAA